MNHPTHATVTIALDGNRAFIDVGPYDGFLIWCALRTQIKSYEDAIAAEHGNAPNRNDNEELMFLHGELAKCYQLLYHLTEDHEGEGRQRQAQAFFEDAFSTDVHGSPIVTHNM